ncbi:hypothetical protein SUGI_1135730 [Cryptomeria japonica]|nr:hypothetical protein SUGI_1135730 [Cryptomeria japonica]
MMGKISGDPPLYAVYIGGMKKSEIERLQREAAEADRRRKEREEAMARAAQEAALERRRQEKALLNVDGFRNSQVECNLWQSTYNNAHSALKNVDSQEYLESGSGSEDNEHPIENVRRFESSVPSGTDDNVVSREISRVLSRGTNGNVLVSADFRGNGWSKHVGPEILENNEKDCLQEDDGRRKQQKMVSK